MDILKQVEMAGPDIRELFEGGYEDFLRALEHGCVRHWLGDVDCKAMEVYFATRYRAAEQENQYLKAENQWLHSMLFESDWSPVQGASAVLYS